jgi:hypothetical protein
LTQFVESTVKFPYKRSLGPVIGEFMNGLANMRFVGIRSGDRVIVPPLEWDPDTGEELSREYVTVGPAGTVTAWCWVEQPTEAHPLDRPFAFALITLDGADTSLLHAVEADGIDGMSVGMRVAPRWKAERTGHITDVDAFVPGEDPVVPDGDLGPPEEPVTMMSYNASVTYSVPVTAYESNVRVANEEHRLFGLRCPVCGRIYTGGKGYCPIDAVAFTDDDEVDLPQTGTITNFTIITPVQYPGQTETEPFPRVFVLLDGFDVVLGYQPLVDCANEDIHVGIRVSARWVTDDDGVVMVWSPNGEDDVSDPELVNRIN